MVANWSPEPSKNLDGGAISLREAPVNFEQDENEEEALTTPYFGYELLSHEIPQNNNLMADDESNSEADSDAEDGDLFIANNQPEYPREELIRPDIEINDDEVRSIMSNIVLPPSSFPSWANEIPESQWNSFLASRLANLQNDNNSKK